MIKQTKKFFALIVAVCVFTCFIPSQPVHAISKIRLSTDTFSKGIYQSLIKAKADSNNDGYLSEKEIANITNLTVKNQFSTKGLELLTSLEVLAIQSFTKEKLEINSYRMLLVSIETTGRSLVVSGDHVMGVSIANDILEELDASQCGYIESISLRCPNLQSINIKECKWIESLRAQKSKLKHVDLTGNPMLESIHLDHNEIEEIDVSNCLNLNMLYIGDNKLSQLDITSNDKLIYLDAENNQLTNLDLTHSSDLFNVNLSNNPLESIDLSALTNVVHLALENCNLKTIDVSQCKKLGSLGLNYNDLSVIDCSENMDLFNIQVIDNKNLKKLYIKDKKNVVKKVLTKTKVLRMKRVSPTSVTVYFEKNPYANNGYVVSTKPLDCISGILEKDATKGTVRGIEKDKKVYVVLYTALDINDTCVYGTEYVSKRKY